MQPRLSRERLGDELNDFLEIGFWRRRQHLVEDVLELAESLVAAREASGELPEQLAAAVQAVRNYDADQAPWGLANRVRAVAS
jgi:hypothetical protein